MASASTWSPGHVVITGAAGAIGSALARAMRVAWPEAELALVDRDEPSGVAAEVRGTPYRADLADLDGLQRLVERIEDRGPIDGLVNCAGVMRVRDVAEWRWEDARELLAIDLLAPLRLQDLVVGGMAGRGSGLIINVASMAGRVPLKGCVYYGAAKAGLAMASEIARADLRRRGVQVVTVYPGPVKSALEAGARAEYGGGGWFGGFAPTGDPRVLAAKIMRAIDEDRARVIYPAVYGAGWIAPNLSRKIALAFGPEPVAQSDFESVTNRRSPAMPATLS